MATAPTSLDQIVASVTRNMPQLQSTGYGGMGYGQPQLYGTGPADWMTGWFGMPSYQYTPQSAASQLPAPYQAPVLPPPVQAPVQPQLSPEAFQPSVMQQLLDAGLIKPNGLGGYVLSSDTGRYQPWRNGGSQYNFWSDG